MTSIRQRRPIASAMYGVAIEPRILPAVGIPLPELFLDDGTTAEDYETAYRTMSRQKKSHSCLWWDRRRRIAM